jgi:hypothetical protein
MRDGPAVFDKRILDGVMVEVAGRHNGVIVAQPRKEKAPPCGRV